MPETSAPAPDGELGRDHDRPALSRRAGLISLGLLVVLAVWGIVGSIANSGDSLLSYPEAVLLGLVEGLTEYLPVSSTGHLAVVSELLGLNGTDAGKKASDAYVIAIQAGAIIAVLGIYRARIVSLFKALAGRDDESRSLLWALVGGFLPAAVIGLLLGDVVKEKLFGTGPIVAAWFVGGLVILLAQRQGLVGGSTALEAIGLREGLIIGVAQALALWPGVSRSLVTILAALLLGLTIGAAVEFSFLLGLITLGAATAYELLKSGGDIADQFGIAQVALGLLIATLSAAFAVAWMVDYLERHSLAVFGWYRIALAVVVAGLMIGTTAL